jgi:AbiU2
MESRMYDRQHVLDAFTRLCIQLKIDFDLYCSLFDRSREQKELLQRTAPYFFGEVWAALLHQLYLGFCRITDPAGSGKRVNLTTNFIVERLCWPEKAHAQLVEVNERLMAFRKLVEPARSKRIAHTDFSAQIEKQSLGGYPEGADEHFFKNLEEFLSIAFRVTTGGPFLLSMATPSDTHRLITALRKAEAFDQCTECGEIDRTNAILDAEQRS